MINIRSFNVRYVAQTNTKPARVRIYDNRYKKAVFISYHNSSSDRVEEIAQAYLLTKGITTTHISEDKKGYLLLTSNFEKL
jgi:hypothetical protein